MSHDLDLERVICPLHGLVVRRGATVRAYVNHCPHAGFPLNWQPDAFLASHALPVRVERGYVVLDERVPLEEPADLGH